MITARAKLNWNSCIISNIKQVRHTPASSACCNRLGWSGTQVAYSATNKQAFGRQDPLELRLREELGIDWPQRRWCSQWARTLLY